MTLRNDVFLRISEEVLSATDGTAALRRLRRPHFAEIEEGGGGDRAEFMPGDTKERRGEVAKDGCEDEENEPPLEKSCDRKDGGLWPLKVKEAAAEEGVKEALN